MFFLLVRLKARSRQLPAASEKDLAALLATARWKEEGLIFFSKRPFLAAFLRASVGRETYSITGLCCEGVRTRILSCRLVYGCVLSWSKVHRSGTRVLGFRAVGPALTTHTHWSRWIHFFNVHGLLGTICRMCISCITQLSLFVTIANPSCFLLNTRFLYLPTFISSLLNFSLHYLCNLQQHNPWSFEMWITDINFKPCFVQILLPPGVG